MSNGISVEVDTAIVESLLEELKLRLEKALSQAGETVGAGMQAYAQNNARWTDRTGDARNKLQYSSTWEAYVLDIALAHQVEYGYWLETRKFPIAGDLSILQEARDSQVETLIALIMSMKL